MSLLERVSSSMLAAVCPALLHALASFFRTRAVIDKDQRNIFMIPLCGGLRVGGWWDPEVWVSYASLTVQ